jgi:hypothetical protein
VLKSKAKKFSLSHNRDSLTNSFEFLLSRRDFMSCPYEDRLDIVADYVRGDLPENEQEAFEIHYVGCEECYRTLRFVEKAAHTIYHYGNSIFAPKAAVKKFAWSESFQKLKTAFIEFSIPEQWKSAAEALAAYALIVAVLSVAFHWIKPGAQEKTPATYVERESIFGPQRSTNKLGTLPPLQPLNWMTMAAPTENAELFTRLDSIRPIYQKGDYQLAAKYLDLLAKNYPQSVEIHLYLGISQLLAHQPTAAVQNLEKVLQANPDHSPAQWYLAHGYLGQRRRTEAQNLLTTLVKKQDPEYSRSAEALLKKIQK